MDAFAQKLQSFMAENGIAGELLWFDSSCHSVAEAAETARADVLDFVKNICMVLPDGRLVVAIVKGEDRASTTNVANVLGLGERPRPATPDEILEKTGYPCGGTPSFGYDAVFLVDERVLERKTIYTGGGSTQALVKMSVSDLLLANGGRVAKIRK
ncbi:MAG: YbaK/EbsC family protein [Candidatus Micrarchaeota archaeon]|nr:YbaK/EbsC family protein [Candidatus Micrarchaeota archaeon]